jgi:spore coat protein U-like protein
MSLARTISLALLCTLAWPAQAAGLGLGLGVALGCSVNTRPIQFGNYEAASTQATKTSSSVHLRCVVGALVNVSFGPSSNSDSISTRKLKHVNKPDTLNYNIYMDSAYSRTWGTVGSGQSLPVVFPLVLGGRDIPVFAAIAPGQDVPVGQYHDNVTVYVEP